MSVFNIFFKKIASTIKFEKLFNSKFTDLYEKVKTNNQKKRFLSIKFTDLAIFWAI